MRKSVKHGKNSKTSTPKENTPWVKSILIAIAIATSILAVYYFMPLPEDPQDTSSNQVETESPPPVDLKPIDSPALSTSSRSTSASQAVNGEKSPTKNYSDYQLPAPKQDINVQSEQAELLKILESSMQDFPRSSKAWHIGGLVYAELLQTENANRCFAKSLELDPDGADVRLAYANSLASLGLIEEALKLLEQSKIERSSDLIRKKGELLTEFGEAEQAIGLIKESIALASENANGWLALAQAELQADQVEQAAEHAQKAISLGSKDRPAFIALATALTRLGRRSEAEAAQAQIAPIKPSTVNNDQYAASFRGFASHNYGQLAQIYLAADLLIEAEKLVTKSLELDPNSIRSLSLLVDMLRKKNQIHGAITVLRKLVELQPSNPVPYHNLASLLNAQGDSASAEQYLRTATKFDDSGYALHFLAGFLMEANRLPEARHIARLSAERTNALEPYLTWLRISEVMGDYESSQQIVAKLRQSWPTDTRVKLLLGE